jgi:hypothetical protein
MPAVGPAPKPMPPLISIPPPPDLQSSPPAADALPSSR